MKKILLLIFVLFSASCTPKIIPEKNISYYSIDTIDIQPKNKVNITLSGIDAVDYLLTKKIIYKENYKWGYFQSGEWICNPDCLLEKNILKALPYIKENTKNRIFIKILDFYADFQSEGTYVVASFKVNLQTENKELTKVFDYKIQTKKDLKDIISGFENIVNSFIKDLDLWLSKNL